MDDFLFCCVDRDKDQEHGLVYEAALKDTTGEEAGSQKCIFMGTINKVNAEGVTTSTPCVICTSQKKVQDDDLRREAHCLKLLQDCKNIVDILMEPTLTRDNRKMFATPCLTIALERVDPVGFDLIEVANQSANLGTSLGLTMPLNRVKFYVHQLNEAISFCHSKNIVHRDLKLDNVLVSASHQVKLIDFGLACVAGFKDPGRLTAPYAAPENIDSRSQAFLQFPVDYWGIGVVIYCLVIGNAADRKCILAGNLTEQLQGQCNEECATAMANLLKARPANRWNTDQIRTWSAGASPISPAGGRLKRTQTMSPVQRWVSEKIPLHAYCVRLPKQWESKKVLDLGLGQIGCRLLLRMPEQKWLVMYDSKKHRKIYLNMQTNEKTKDVPEGFDEMERNPGPDTLIKPKDLLYVGINDEADHAKLAQVFGQDLNTETSRRISEDSHNSLHIAQAMLEFDSFEFPPHCANGVLGPERFAGQGQNALDLRHSFDIPVHGIQRSSGQVLWFPGADTTIQTGDMGLVIRAPSSESQESVVEATTIWNLQEEASFRALRNLKDDEKWKTWQTNLRNMPAQAG